MQSLSLTPEESIRSKHLTQKILNAVRNTNKQALTFGQFMDLALYDSEFGYYTAGTRTVGPSGDFITAPELGNLFGRTLASKLAESLSGFDSPSNLYEFGAGSGRLAVQILHELDKLECRISEYGIIELSPVLRNVQQNTIRQAEKHLGEKVKWYDHLPPQGMKGIVIANEVLDAMPVELFCMEKNELLQGYVVESDTGFALEFRNECEADFEASFAALDLPEIAQPYISELHCRAEAWLRTIANHLDCGSILITDYGFPVHEYYHSERSQGTLMCHRRHHVLYDPLSYIGCQDITAHINFSNLARIAVESGMEVNGFTSFAAFLVDAGIECGELKNRSEIEKGQMLNEFITLVTPSEMGEIFKVIEFTKNFDSTITGFETADRSHSLFSKKFVPEHSV